LLLLVEVVAVLEEWSILPESSRKSKRAIQLPTEEGNDDHGSWNRLLGGDEHHM